MARKYTKDYRVTDALNDAGIREQRIEYIGAEYVWREPEAARKALRLSTWLCVLGWSAFLLPLLPRSAATQTWYVLPPFLFSALPLGLLSGLVLRLRRCGDTLAHRQADQAENRIPACALFMMLLPGLALAGEAVLLLRQRALLSAADALFALCALLLFVCGLLLRRQAAHFRTRLRKN